MYTLKELHLKICELAESTNVYTFKWLKNKLKEKYREHIFFAKIKGRANVVCFKDLASYLEMLVSYKWCIVI